MSAYLGSTKVWESADANDWVRPASWLALPTIVPTDQKIVGLHCVWPTDGNFCALTCSGAYTVDWGDGETEDRTAGQTAYHEYIYTNPNLNSAAVATHGYKQALVTITPQSGQNLTSVNFFVNHDRAGLVGGYATGWLDIAFSAPLCTVLTFSGTSATTVRHRMIERIVIVKCGNINTLATTFNGCTSLQSVDLTGLAGAPINSLANVFNGCSSLSSVDLTPFTGNVLINTLLNVFYNCSSLQSVDLTPLTSAPVNTLSGAFQGCYALQSVDLTGLAGAPITTLANVFNGCYALQSVDLTGLAGAPINSLSGTFNACYSLSSVDLSPLTGAPITTLATTFNGCSSLQSVDLTPLTSAPITTMTDTFTGCVSLAKLIAPVPVSFTVAGRLSANALNEMYSSLRTGVTGKTVTVTGNYGVSGDDPSLVPTGWTVSG